MAIRGKKKGKQTAREQLESLEKDVLALKTKVRLLEKQIKTAQVWGFVRFAVIAVPVVIGIGYAVPILRELFSFYNAMFDQFPEIQGLLKRTSGF